ncbi:MAG: hypothetical protein FJ221_10245 [Lentisphaerae bacterium]|nr:hypothetical protein [Lentisphaerota bacterium]
MSTFLGVAVLAVLALFLLGWIVPLVFGIRRARGRRGGTALIVIGGVWGAGAVSLVAMIALAYIGFRGARTQSQTKTFDVATHTGKQGIVRTACAGPTTLQVVEESSGAAMNLESTTGEFAAPAGKLRLQRFTTTARGADGATWTVAGYTFARDQQVIDVAPGGTVALRLGPPYRAVVTTSRQVDGQQAFDLAMTGAGGSRVSMYVQGPNRKPMRFEVLDASGRSVWSGNFEYG